MQVPKFLQGIWPTAFVVIDIDSFLKFQNKSIRQDTFIDHLILLKLFIIFIIPNTINLSIVI